MRKGDSIPPKTLCLLLGKEIQGGKPSRVGSGFSPRLEDSVRILTRVRPQLRSTLHSVRIRSVIQADPRPYACVCEEGTGGRVDGDLGGYQVGTETPNRNREGKEICRSGHASSPST